MVNWGVMEQFQTVGLFRDQVNYEIVSVYLFKKIGEIRLTKEPIMSK